jgi:hypothetical protein
MIETLPPGPRRAGARAWVVAVALMLCACGMARAAEKREADPFAVSKENREYARRMLEAVEIRGQSRSALRDAIQRVFLEAGMKSSSRGGDEMVFERAATRGERAAYGSWHGDDVAVRVRVDLISIGTDAYLARSRCLLVRNPGGLAEDEQRLARGRARPYEGLLRKAAEGLSEGAQAKRSSRQGSAVLE